ncbi:regulatory protein, ArsR [Pseudonocardia sp. Ae168_Ps1]|uniref:ArsR/SmtB family transcription factor n=1 Tax=unclassified Pseudonocardia TaxID=2619320 RepID=UPI00094B4957|nr:MULTISPECIES: metalloregulator ArsR/SmtB family transcription factor [unclassified Pseudonocardia]OLL74830.1 regulatory protein, ArsR [Pseudonocardia sp. Ae150A_Ps1]OLL80822.1 regulatory protein, ArsR [Pseudonocardia sp. Ae168_Ps1]OLL85060.1 regulatory protein, ArsR [Pseudonocardia sp. Ae263_Ps1]OLL94923.1 regulatory protein, ArsR [Pseudonocardia sp. Ae356_Ps1]
MTEDDTCELLCLDLPHAERIRTALPGLAALEPVAGLARGLGDPTRLRVARALLAGDELCVCDTAWIVGSSQALVSHHLRRLRTAGIVASRKDGRMVMYRLTGRGRALLSVLFDTDTDADAGTGTGLPSGAGRG